MRLPRTTSRTWVFFLFLLPAASVLPAPFAAAQEPPFAPQAHLAPEVRSRLAEAARDQNVKPWQRDFMLGLAGGRTEGGATGLSRSLPGLALPPDGVGADAGSWIGIPPPSGRARHTAIYDPVRDCMLVFGGYDRGYDNSDRNDVWAFSLAGSLAWIALAPAGGVPTGRDGHTAIYDPVRDRMVVFGGFDGISYRNDVWALSLSGSPAWSVLAPAGSPPAGRSRHTAIYDPVRDRMIVFGGVDASSYRNDVWALSLAGSLAWSALAPAGSAPAGRSRHTAIYDPVRDRMVVFGGMDASSYRDDVWALSLAGSPAWSALAPAGSTPTGRYGHTAIYDPVRDRMVVFGGYDGISPFGYRDEVWALSLAGSPAWSEVVPAGLRPTRYGHTAIYDPVRDRMVVFGGADLSSYSTEVWALSLAGSPAWSALTTRVPFSGRDAHTAIHDPVRDRMVVFGGYDGYGFRRDARALSLAGSPTWSTLAPAGSPPTSRFGPAAIYDPVRDRMVVFAGADSFGYCNDVWALSLAGSPAWSALAPAGSPPAGRSRHTAIYDPVRDRMIVFGGVDANGYRDDVWALSLAGSPAWSEVVPAGSPPTGRYGHTAIYDPVRDRMIVFGGVDASGYRDDVWALSLAGSPAWSALAPAGSAPTGRYGHTAIYDPVRDRMVVFGGYDGISYRNDVWALSLAGSPAWSALAPAGSAPTGRYGHTAIYDPVRDQMLVFAGLDGMSFRNDVCALRWGATVSVAQDVRGRLRLGAARPNPSRGVTSVDFDLGEPARVVLEVFDAQGRRVRRIADEWLNAGRHVSTWRGDDEGGHTLGSGVYFIRMQAGAFQATRRAVRVR